MTRGELLRRLQAVGLDARRHDVDHAERLFERPPGRVGDRAVYDAHHLAVVRVLVERRQARREQARAKASA